MKRLLILGCILACPVIGWSLGCDAVNVACYVRAGASGSHTGTNWTTAYVALPATLTRGVTYYVATGAYPAYTFSTADSGTTSITVQAATIASHGIATGWSNAYQGQAVWSCASACGAVLTFNHDYITFNGVYRSTATGNPETDWVLESGYGFKVDNSNCNGSGCPSTNSSGDDIGGGSGYNGGTCGSLAACSAAGMFVHDITISYTDVNGTHIAKDAWDVDYQMDFEGGSYNVDFSHDFVHDGAVPFFLRGSHAHQAGGGYWFGSGDGNTVEYTYVKHNYSSPNYHSEGCSCSEGLTNFTWRYNYSDQIGGVGSNGSTAHIGTASGADYNNGNGPNGPWNIYGNVFTCSATSSTMNCAVGDGVLAVWDAQFTGNIYFLNNTMYNLGSHSPESGFAFGLGLTTPLAAVYSENNLWFANDPMTVIPTGTTSTNGATMTSTTWSYNAYFNTPNGGSSDPDSHKQVSATNPFSNSGACCSLTSDTTAGTSTHSLLAGNDTDMFGTARGANGTWDRGAVQIGSTFVYPPTNVTVTTH